MFDWLAAAIGSLVLATSTPGVAPAKKGPPPQNKETARKEQNFASVDAACMAAAVAARESALQSAVSKHGADLAAAYGARAAALSAAYANTGGKAAIKQEIRKAWDTFNASARLAKRAWQSAKDTAWKNFRTAAKNCGASSDISDANNASMEPKGE